MMYLCLVVIAETGDLMKKLIEWKNNVENEGMRVNVNKTKWRVVGVMLKAAR